MPEVASARVARPSHLCCDARIVAPHTANPLTIASSTILTTSPGVPEKAAITRVGRDHARVLALTRAEPAGVAAVELTGLRESVRSGRARAPAEASARA